MFAMPLIVAVLIMIVGLAPNVMSSPTASLQRRRLIWKPSPIVRPHYCDGFKTNLITYKDYIECHCLDKCIYNVERLVDPELEHAHTEIVFSIYNCGLKCFDPDFSPIPESDTIVSLLVDRYQMGQPITGFNESSYYEMLLSSGINGSFKEFITTLHTDLKTRMAKDLKPQFKSEIKSEIKADLPDVCYAKLMLGVQEVQDAEQDLEKMLYCRHFLSCMEDLLDNLVENRKSTAEPKTFYECSKRSFTENPLRIPIGIQTASTIAIRTVSCAATTQPQPSLCLWLVCLIIFVIFF